MLSKELTSDDWIASIEAKLTASKDKKATLKVIIKTGYFNFTLGCIAQNSSRRRGYVCKVNDVTSRFRTESDVIDWS